MIEKIDETYKSWKFTAVSIAENTLIKNKFSAHFDRSKITDSNYRFLGM